MLGTAMATSPQLSIHTVSYVHFGDNPVCGPICGNMMANAAFVNCHGIQLYARVVCQLLP